MRERTKHDLGFDPRLLASVVEAAEGMVDRALDRLERKGEDAMVANAEAVAESRQPRKTNEGMKIRRDGSVVIAETRLGTYKSIVGNVYASRFEGKGDGPKRLLDATLVGGEWVALIEPANGGEGRVRSVLLSGFVQRYRVDFERRNNVETKPSSRREERLLAVEARLALVERKLDEVMVKVDLVVRELMGPVSGVAKEG